MKPSEFIDYAASFVGEECLPWPHGRTRGGHGFVRVLGANGRPTTTTAHRQVLIAAAGPPPSDRHVAAHGCHNRACVNPAHLRWATLSENQLDRIADGTSNRALSDDQVREIRAGLARAPDLAARFGVSLDTIYAAKTGRRYKHVA